VPEYQAARQLIAKSHDIEAATNPATGDVNAAKIAQLSMKRPLTGSLNSIADTALAFPKVMQNPSKFGGVEPLSTLDLGAAAFAASKGKYDLAAGILGKPMVRALIMSDKYQGSIANPSQFSAASYAPSQLQPLVNALSQYNQGTQQ